ncbi:MULTISPECIES: RadC family protein [Enterobacterales]|uniref:RadC family protein n=1 Tax=Enterobacterales TaxID=91347 RepID=UPI002EDBA505
MFPFSSPTSTFPTISLTAQRTIKRAIRLLDNYLRQPGVTFNSSTAARDWLRLQLSGMEREVFMVLYLDNQHRLITHETLFSGTINSVGVHPREVVKSALKHNAAAVALAHNHPSGLAEPSQSDRRMTEKLQQALALVDVRVLDHFVTGSHDIVSFAERGWL